MTIAMNNMTNAGFVVLIDNVVKSTLFPEKSGSNIELIAALENNPEFKINLEQSEEDFTIFDIVVDGKTVALWSCVNAYQSNMIEALKNPNKVIIPWSVEALPRINSIWNGIEFVLS